MPTMMLMVALVMLAVCRIHGQQSFALNDVESSAMKDFDPKKADGKTR